VTSATTERHARFQRVAGALERLDDRPLRDLVESAPVLGTGIGGTRVLLHVDGVPVFVKRVPLTDLERLPHNVRSTANLFDLPLECQYGVGSPSFGVWREVAANEMTTSWVLAGRSPSFPLMFHWRVLDGTSAVVAEELADVEHAVEYWHGSPAVRGRLEAIAESSATVTLFFEHLPHVLPEWLNAQVARGNDAVDTAIAMVERGLRHDVEFMNGAGLFHFDAHLDNILTDGHRLYFTDFGLATSMQFDLSAAEVGFLNANRTHDAGHTVTRLVDWIVSELVGAPDWMARDELIVGYAAGEPPVGLTTTTASVVRRYAPIAVVMNEFYRQLHLVDRRTTYPTAAARDACAASGFPSLGPADPDQ
jgi:hypothetical protein